MTDSSAGRVSLHFESRSNTAQMLGASVLSLSLLANRQAAVTPRQHVIGATVTIAQGSGGTVQILETGPISDLDLFSALTEFHDRLVVDQVELDPQAREILEANLWHLYA